MNGKNKVGRPQIGTKISVDLPDELVDRLGRALNQSHLKGGVPASIGVDGVTWSFGFLPRAELIRRLLEAGIGMFEHYVLRQSGAVKLGKTCPICFGYVDGPHQFDCGYFGPLAENDQDFDARLRRVLADRGRSNDDADRLPRDAEELAWMLGRLTASEALALGARLHASLGAEAATTMVQAAEELRRPKSY